MSQPGAEPMRPALREITARDWLVAAVPLLVFGGLMIACLTSGADHAISSWFYSPESNRWSGRESTLFRFCYEHGCTPAIGLGVGGLLVALPTFWLASWRPLRKPGLFLGLTLILGPGLLVNGLLKPKLARVRPAQSVDFVGQDFLAKSGQSAERGNFSFPSGHASMGFYLMIPALLLHRSQPALAVMFFGGGVACGLLIGVARVAQGAHFASDVLGSALCVWSTALLVLTGRRVLMWSLLRLVPDAAPRLLRLPEVPNQRAA